MVTGGATRGGAITVATGEDVQFGRRSHVRERPYGSTPSTVASLLREGGAQTHPTCPSPWASRRSNKRTDRFNWCMMIVTLSAIEAKIVRDGRIHDPKWKPFPRSVLDRTETDGERTRALTRQRRTTYLEVNARSQDWRGRKTRQGLLVATVSNQPHFIGIASGTLKSSDGYRGIARVRLGPWWTFAEPVELSSVLDELDPTTRSSLIRILEEEETRDLPKVTNERVIEALWVLTRDWDAALQATTVGSEIPSAARVWEPEDLPELDASQTALRLFSPGWNALGPSEEEPEPSRFALEISDAFRATENDYITDDATTFLDWEQQPRANHGWFEFRDEGRKLLVKNINVSHAETMSGADLVYVRRDPDAVVLVQYKLLEQSKTEPYFRDPKGRLASQVSRMLKFANAAEPGTTDEAEYRLGRDIGFVKFIVPAAPRATSTGDIRPDGRYHPAGSVDRMLRTPDKGPFGGKVFYTRRWRYVDGEVFARLVRDRWIGTCEDATARLLEVVGLFPSGRQVCIAVDEPA